MVLLALNEYFKEPQVLRHRVNGQKMNITMFGWKFCWFNCDLTLLAPLIRLTVALLSSKLCKIPVHLSYFELFISIIYTQSNFIQRIKPRQPFHQMKRKKKKEKKHSFHPLFRGSVLIYCVWLENAMKQ